MDGPQTNIGGDQYTTYTNVYASNLPQPVQLKDSRRALHYCLVFLSLLSNLIVWTFLGFFASSEFPIIYIWEILIACFKGPEALGRKLSENQQFIQNLRNEDLRAKEETSSYQEEDDEYCRLNNLSRLVEIQQRTIKLLYKEAEEAEERKARTQRVIDSLEKKKKMLEVDLIPLKREHSPTLYKLEKIVEVIVNEKDVSSEKDHELNELALADLSQRYKIFSNPPSSTEANMLVNDFRNILKSNAYGIQVHRLGTLRNALALMRWISQATEQELPNNLEKREDKIRINQSLSEWIAESNFKKEEITDIYRRNREHARQEQIKRKKDEEMRQEKQRKEALEKVRQVWEKKEEEKKIAWLESVIYRAEKLLAVTKPQGTTYKAFRTGIRNEWIQSIFVIGLDPIRRNKQTELRLNVSWQSRREAISTSESQQIEVELQQISEFEAEIIQNAWIPEWRCTYVSGVDEEECDRILGFSNASTIPWEPNKRKSLKTLSSRHGCKIQVTYLQDY